MLTLKNGRPEDCSGRLYKEIRVYDMLDAAGVEYQRIDHEAVYTMGECEERETLLNAKICKNLFLCNRPKTHFYMLMIPGDKKLKMKELSKQLGLPHLSFADEKYMDETGRFCLDQAEPIAYSHGTYYSLGEKLGTFGYSVKKKK